MVHQMAEELRGAMLAELAGKLSPSPPAQGTGQSSPGRHSVTKPPGEAGRAGGRANRHAPREPDTGGRSGEARKIPFFPLPMSLQCFLPEKLNIMPSGKGKMFEQAQIPLPRAGKKVNLELEAINRLLP